MLAQLYIKNFAVIKELTVLLEEGFNVFTGETGAGKTMLINAINGILGGRISKELVRNGEDKASIWGHFTDIPDNILAYCEELGFDCLEDEILISRDLTKDGRSNCKINGKPATLSILRDISKNLIAIHGQQDTGYFLNTENDVDFLDSYGDYAAELKDYKDCFEKYSNVKKQIDKNNINIQQREQKIDILTYQINEIEQAEITVGEEEQLIEERRKIKNSEKIRGLLGSINALMNDGEGSLLEQTEAVSDCLNSVSEYMDNYTELAKRCESVMYELQDIYSTARNDLEEFDVDEESLEYIEERIELIHKLQRKYGSTEEKIIDFLNNASRELEELSSIEEKSENLKKEYETLKNALKEKSQRLTEARKITAEEFIKRVESELKFLDMPSVKLDIKITPERYTEKGADLAEFLISTNPGEPMKPISKIASGGETSRIMLAIKNVMADKDNIHTLIFDEIDTGVSGTAAQKIGQKLKEVSKNHQVICITHLAQVASFGNMHLKIHKEFEEGKTFTKVDVLTENQRVKELARIVVGDNITETALNNAKEMLERNS